MLLQEENFETVDPIEYEEINSDPQELYEHFRFVVDKGQSLMRIDKYLVNIMPHISRNKLQEVAEIGNILVNGAPVKSNYRVKPDNVISIVLSYPPADYVVVPQNIPITVVYEDSDILLINKPAGMVVHPGFGNFEGTLLNAVAYHLQDSDHFDANDQRVGLVHRIDKDTSGLLLVAKTEQAKAHLGKQFFEKTTHRRYLALVWGNVKEDSGTISGFHARDPKDRMCFKFFEQQENPWAKWAVTHYRVVERFGYTTLVECKLETGRTHQIRVHMKHIGHPLFNDERYGGNSILKGTNTAFYKLFVKNCFHACPRQALHAKTLGFLHPRTLENMYFDSELPQDFSQLIEMWKDFNKTMQ